MIASYTFPCIYSPNFEIIFREILCIRLCQEIGTIFHMMKAYGFFVAFKFV
jgi:hypothetical protein